MTLVQLLELRDQVSAAAAAAAAAIECLRLVRVEYNRRLDWLVDFIGSFAHGAGEEPQLNKPQLDVRMLVLFVGMLVEF